MINNNYFLLNVFILAIGTFFIRVFFIAMSEKMNISAKVKELFTFIPVAIFPAMIFPAVFFHKGEVSWLFEHERLFVLLLASAAGYFIRNTFFIISFGLILLYLLNNELKGFL